MTRRWDFTATQQEVQDVSLLDTSVYDENPDDVGFARIEQHNVDVDAQRAGVHVIYQAISADIVRRSTLLINDDSVSPAVTDYTDLRMAIVAPADYAEDVASTTADSGSETTITKTGAGWTVDAKKKLIVTVTGGTNSGEARELTSNTADTLTFPAMPVACDNTTVFQVNQSRASLYEETLLEMAMANLGVAGAFE